MSSALVAASSFNKKVFEAMLRSCESTSGLLERLLRRTALGGRQGFVGIALPAPLRGLREELRLGDLARCLLISSASQAVVVLENFWIGFESPSPRVGLEGLFGKPRCLAGLSGVRGRWKLDRDELRLGALSSIDGMDEKM